MAVALLRSGDAGRARQQLHEALERLAKSEVEHQDDMAAIHANLARAAVAMGDTQAKPANSSRQRTMYRQVIPQAASDGERRALQSELAAVLDLRALTLAKHDQPAATEMSRQAMLLHQQCCDNAAAPLDWLRRLAASQHNYASLLFQQGQDAAARSMFKSAIATKLTVGQRSGLRPGTGADAAVSYLTLGRLERRLHQTSAASDCFEQAIAAVKHDLIALLRLKNRLLLAESLASYWRLNKDEKTRLELNDF